MLDVLKVVVVLLRLQLAPNVLQLRPFKLALEKRWLGYSFSLLSEKNVVMQPCRRERASVKENGKGATRQFGGGGVHFVSRMVVSLSSRGQRLALHIANRDRGQNGLKSVENPLKSHLLAGQVNC